MLPMRMVAVEELGLWRERGAYLPPWCELRGVYGRRAWRAGMGFGGVVVSSSVGRVAPASSCSPKGVSCRGLHWATLYVFPALC